MRWKTHSIWHRAAVSDVHAVDDDDGDDWFAVERSFHTNNAIM